VSASEEDRRKQAANLKRRLFMLRFHALNRDFDGKSAIARRGGQARMARDPGGPRAAALQMALTRWHPQGDS
jgi:hypothetical protein